MLFIVAVIVGMLSLFLLKMKVDEESQGVVRGVSWGIFALCGIVALFCCFTIVPAGYVGVQDCFGNVMKGTLKSGFNVKLPVSKIVMMNIRTRENKETSNTPTKEGLVVGLDVSLIYHLNSSKASDIYSSVGKDYESVIVQPQFRSVIRDVTASYEAKDLYSSSREQLARMMIATLKKEVQERGIEVENILLRNIDLPGTLKDAIAAKLTAEQTAQKMQFVLQKESQEADRKRIEAQGIADFQRIVRAGIDEQLLKWKGIEATEKLAESPNAKIIVIGGGKDGLPIILSGDTK